MNFKTTFSALTMALAFGLSAQAHQLQNIKTPTDPVAAAVLTKGNAWAESMKDGAVTESFKVTKLTPSAKNPNESEEEALTRVLKYHLHRTYPITGDDGGYGFTKMNGQTERNLRVKMDDWFVGNGDEIMEAPIAELLNALLPASQSQDLVLLYGSGSGNNTAAYIIAVLDLKNKEITYLMVSNFGSDN
jgi:hypothetical protein